MDKRSSIRSGRSSRQINTDLTKEDIKEILLQRITEEEDAILTNLTDVKLSQEAETRIQKDKVSIVSLFAGAGGLDLGAEIAGLNATLGEAKTFQALQSRKTYNETRKSSLFQTIYANDMFAEALETHKSNFPEGITYNRKDIRKISHFPKSNIVIGGFPCPGYSHAGPRLIDDKRNFLYIHFIRVLLQTQPDFFIAENVKGLMTLGSGEVLNQIVEDFSAAGYTVTAHLVNAKDYGVPQTRERVFLVGVHKSKIEEQYNYEYDFPRPTHNETEQLSAGIKAYTTLKDSIKDLEDNPGYIYEGSYSSMYMSRNRKKTWESQSFTIQASGRQAPQHPGGEPMLKTSSDEWSFQGELNRRLSTKEIARIQTFPDWFEFKTGRDSESSPNMTDINKIYKQIGNAVPVLLAVKALEPIAEFYSTLKKD